jgi:Flp pilus assembly protein TadG
MKRQRSTAGAVAVEFAIIASVFIALLLLAMETGWQLVIESTLNAGARAASRFGSTGTTIAAGITPAPTDRNSSIMAVAVQYSGGVLRPDRLQISEASYANFTAITGGGANTPGPGTASQVVQYTFTYTQPYMTPYAAAIAGDSNMIHTVGVTVLNEPFPAN